MSNNEDGEQRYRYELEYTEKDGYREEETFSSFGDAYDCAIEYYKLPHIKSGCLTIYFYRVDNETAKIVLFKYKLTKNRDRKSACRKLIVV